MSTRCTIVHSYPIHIYACVNTYDEDGEFEICMSDVDASHDSWNGDVILGKKCLHEIYDQLKKYFDKNE